MATDRVLDQGLIQHRSAQALVLNFRQETPQDLSSSGLSVADGDGLCSLSGVGPDTKPPGIVGSSGPGISGTDGDGLRP
jgi:hypothetical protein